MPPPHTSRSQYSQGSTLAGYNTSRRGLRRPAYDRHHCGSTSLSDIDRHVDIGSRRCRHENASQAKEAPMRPRPRRDDGPHTSSADRRYSCDACRARRLRNCSWLQGGAGSRSMACRACLKNRRRCLRRGTLVPPAPRPPPALAPGVTAAVPVLTIGPVPRVGAPTEGLSFSRPGGFRSANPFVYSSSSSDSPDASLSDVSDIAMRDRSASLDDPDSSSSRGEMEPINLLQDITIQESSPTPDPHGGGVRREERRSRWASPHTPPRDALRPTPALPRRPSDNTADSPDSSDSDSDSDSDGLFVGQRRRSTDRSSGASLEDYQDDDDDDDGRGQAQSRNQDGGALQGHYQRQRSPRQPQYQPNSPPRPNNYGSPRDRFLNRHRRQSTEDDEDDDNPLRDHLRRRLRHLQRSHSPSPSPPPPAANDAGGGQFRTRQQHPPPPPPENYREAADQFLDRFRPPDPELNDRPVGLAGDPRRGFDPFVVPPAPPSEDLEHRFPGYWMSSRFGVFKRRSDMAVPPGFPDQRPSPTRYGRLWAGDDDEDRQRVPRSPAGLSNIPTVRLGDVRFRPDLVGRSCQERVVLAGGGTRVCGQPVGPPVTHCQDRSHERAGTGPRVVCADCDDRGKSVLLSADTEQLRTAEIMGARGYACASCLDAGVADRAYFAATGRRVWGYSPEGLRMAAPSAPAPARRRARPRFAWGGEEDEVEDVEMQEEREGGQPRPGDDKFRGQATPVFGCGCAKLLSAGLCQAHRLGHMESWLAQAALVNEWMVTTYGRRVCPVCRQTRRLGVDAHAFRGRGGGEGHAKVVWACLVCQEFVVVPREQGMGLVPGIEQVVVDPNSYFRKPSELYDVGLL